MENMQISVSGHDEAWGNGGITVVSTVKLTQYFSMCPSESVSKPTGYIMRNGVLTMCAFDCVGTELILFNFFIRLFDMFISHIIIKYASMNFEKEKNDLFWAGGFFPFTVMIGFRVAPSLSN